MTASHQLIADSRKGTEIAYIEQHLRMPFRVRIEGVCEKNGVGISSNWRQPECRRSRRIHTDVYALMPAVTLAVLTILSFPALSAAQDMFIGFSPIFPPASTPVGLPSTALSRASSFGPTASMPAVPSIDSITTPYPISSAPIQLTSNQTTTPEPSPSKRPTRAPTISPAPTLSPSFYPTITPRPSELPSMSPTEFPSGLPSGLPSPAPTFDEISVGTTNLLQTFKVGNDRIFNESEVFTFKQIMTGYTYNISDGSDLSKVNATCTIITQTLLVIPERRTFRRRFLRLLQDVATTSNASNQVEYTMTWESYHVNVTEYPSLFSRFIEDNLVNLTADLRKGDLDVLSSGSLRAIVTTEVPSAAPSISPKPTPNPFRPITSSPSLDPTAGYSDEPSGVPPSKPSNQGSAGNASVITNTIVIVSILSALAIVSCCGCFVFYHRRKQIRELEFQAAAAAGRLSSENDNGEGKSDRLEHLAVDTSAPYNDAPRSDDEQGIISPNESLLSNQSLISTGMSLGEGSIDEADRTHNLADAFDQYKDQNLEKVRADVEERVIGSDSMMNQAMTLAFMGDDEIFSDARELIAGEGADSTEIEADLLCEVNDFLKRNEFADVEER